MIRTTTTALPVPSQAARAAIRELPRTVEAHDERLSDTPAFQHVETGGRAEPAPLDLPFRVGAWNLERCLFPAQSARRIADCDLVLLSEMDSGMARTGQRHTTADLARPLGMAWVYGVEFLELGLGSATELPFCIDPINMNGFHGNALMARSPLVAPFLIRLSGRRQWFTDATDQPRLGERMAIGARIETVAGRLIAVSTHLESATGPEHRAAQIEGLIATLDAEFPGLPVLIGGDLNTGNHAGGDWRAEGLFDIARAAGFAVHGGPDEAMTTRPSKITRFPDRAMKLDWFLARGVTLADFEICPALDDNGEPLSDHELISARVVALG